MSEDIKMWSSQCQELEGWWSPSSATFWTFAHPAHVDDLQKRRREIFLNYFGRLCSQDYRRIISIYACERTQDNLNHFSLLYTSTCLLLLLTFMCPTSSFLFHFASFVAHCFFCKKKRTFICVFTAADECAGKAKVKVKPLSPECAWKMSCGC